MLYNDKNLKGAFYNDKCDKYDYLVAAGCGMLAGAVDVFLVGMPGDSKLQVWTDEQVNNSVKIFAKTCGWNPKSEESVASAIGFLERKFPVNYDQRHSGDVGGLFNMSAKNHHMKSLSHSPSIVGLFFSILNQFTSTASFFSDGRLITVKTDTYELQGGNFIAKLFCGITNWFGHIMSDVAGSSGSVTRGSGIVIPFYEMFQLCNFGSFDINGNRNTIADIATKVFEEGYDFRFGLTMSIPVLLCELSIKLLWAIRRYFYHKKPFRECIPTKRHDSLRVMLLIGNGTLCSVDLVDAIIRSGGNWVNFFLRLNIIAWFRFVSLGFREICIRLGISLPMQRQLDAFMRINEALTLYLNELRKIDIERFRVETERCNQLFMILESATTEEELTVLLKNQYDVLGLTLPYSGDFNDFMNDKSSRLEFK